MAADTAGRYGLSKAQAGYESTPGTAVPATMIWRGTASHIDDQRTVTEVMEAVGLFGGTDRTYIPKLLAQLAINETEATFEQLPYLFVMMFGMNKTGVADGSGSSGYVYTGNIPEGSAPTMTGRFMTWETGDDIQAHEMEYTHCLEINLKGTGGEAVKVTATLQGRQSTRTTFTADLTLDAVEEILASKGALYIDAIGGSYGSTQISQQLLAFDITFKVIWTLKYTLDGALYFTFPQYTGHEITGSMTFEHDSTSIVGSGDQIEKWRAQTAQKMRLQFTGGAYGTAGTDTTFSGLKGLRIDLPFKWTRFAPVGEQDGNSIIVADFKSRYNATAADAGSIVIANEVDAL